MWCKKKYHILVDIDDVLFNLVIAWVAWLNEKYELSVRAEDVDTWMISEKFPTLTTEQVFEPLYIDEFWSTVTAKEGAVENITRLLDDGHKITLVSNSNFETMRAKMTRLFELYPMLSWENVIIACDKHVVNGDILIDDGIHNLEGNPIRYKFLMDMPHNAYYQETLNNGIIRMQSWDVIYWSITLMSSLNKQRVKTTKCFDEENEDCW